MNNILNFVIQNKIALFFVVFIILIAQLILIMSVRRKGIEAKTVEEIFAKKLPANLTAPIYGIIVAIAALISAIITFLISFHILSK